MTAYEDTVELTGKGNVEHTTELLGSVELTGKGVATIGLAFQALAELTGKGDLSNFAGSYTDWQYRKPITIANNSGGALSNHQVLITLTTANFDYSKCKADGSDIRFAASDGSIALSYWIKDWNYNGTSKIWVKVDSIPEGSNACGFIYFWKPTATSESNIVNTYLLGADFHDNDLSGWVTISGSPAVSGGMISVGANVEFEISKPSDIIEGIWEFDYQYPNGAPTSNAIRLLTQWVSAGNYYYLDRASHVTRRRFGRFVSSSELELITSSLAFDTDWHTLKLRRDSSGNFELFEDDVSLGTIADTSHITSNELRLKSAGANHPGLNVDNIRVRKYASSEPVATLGEEEEGVFLSCTWTLSQSAEIEGKGDPTCLLSFQPLLEPIATGGISVDMTSAFHDLVEFTGVGDFLAPHVHTFADLDSFLIENFSIRKTIQDPFWKFKGDVENTIIPTYFKTLRIIIPDHEDVNRCIFLGFIPGAGFDLAVANDKATLNGFDQAWYLQAQYVPTSLRATDEDMNPATIISTLLGNASWASATGIEPYCINPVTGWSAIKKSFIFDTKATKWKAIQEICAYCHHIFLVKWRKTADNQYYSCAYFVHEDEFDDYLDLPGKATITNPDDHLISRVKKGDGGSTEYPVQIEEAETEKYNRITVSGIDIETGTWYHKTVESPGVISGDEIPIEFKYESSDLNTQEKVDALADALYLFYHTIAKYYYASFDSRMDFELYQKLEFIDFPDIPDELMRITGLTFDCQTTQNIVTVLFTSDQKLSDLRKLLRSMGRRDIPDWDLAKIAVGTILEISESGKTALVEIDRDETIVRARILNP